MKLQTNLRFCIMLCLHSETINDASELLFSAFKIFRESCKGAMRKLYAKALNMPARLPLLGTLTLLFLSIQVWSQAPAIQWSRFYGNAGGAGAVKTIQTPDGGFLVGAQVFAGGGMVSNYHGAEDIWLFKLDVLCRAFSDGGFLGHDSGHRLSAI